MQRYGEYKDSGIEWLGEIPKGWKVKKLKHLIQNLESGISVNSIGVPASKGNFGILKTSCVYHYDFDNTENKEILPSELIRAKVSPRKGEIIISRMNTPELVGASGYIEKDYPNLFLPDRLWQTEIFKHLEINTKWLAQIFKSLPFRKYLSVLATGTSPSMKNLGQEDFLNIKIPFMEIDEQNAIANYLEKKTTEIKELIRDKQQLIKLYEEEKIAIINQAVTKGLDTNAKMKNSDISWLGEIPESWEVKKIKHLIRNLESGVSVNSIDEPATNGNFGILKTSCVYHYDFDSTKNKEILPSEVTRAKVSPRKGGIIISRMNTPELVGASGYIEKDEPNLFLPDRLWQTQVFEHLTINTKWLAQIFKSLPFREYLSILATGTSPSMKNLGQEDFLNIKIPFMEIDEQNSVLEHIENESKRINDEITKTKRIIELQQEYCTALISEAITGKFKVPALVEKELD